MVSIKNPGVIKKMEVENDIHSVSTGTFPRGVSKAANSVSPAPLKRTWCEGPKIKTRLLLMLLVIASVKLYNFIDLHFGGVPSTISFGKRFTRVSISSMGPNKNSSSRDRELGMLIFNCGNQLVYLFA